MILHRLVTIGFSAKDLPDQTNFSNAYISGSMCNARGILNSTFDVETFVNPAAVYYFTPFQQVRLWRGSLWLIRTQGKAAQFHRRPV
jgi:hypothetical protein